MEHVRDFDFIIASHYLLQLAFKYALCVVKKFKHYNKLEELDNKFNLILKTFISENRE